MKYKECTKCKKLLAVNFTNFFRSGKNKKGKQLYQPYCKKCQYNSYQNTTRYKIYHKNYTLQTRLDALKAYSNGFPKCKCCGEKIIEFLGIDHINGGGSKHRKKLIKQGLTIYLWLRKNNYPKGYQILCHNCNLAKGFYGICPHQKT